jgi:hypothetical protein
MMADWSGDATSSDSVAGIDSSGPSSSQDEEYEEGQGHNLGLGGCGSSDSSFLTDADFASAVARAAELSGMTVVGTTITDPKANNGEFKVVWVKVI